VLVELDDFLGVLDREEEEEGGLRQVKRKQPAEPPEPAPAGEACGDASFEEPSAIAPAPLLPEAPRVPRPPPSKRLKPASAGVEGSQPPHRMRSHRRPTSSLSGSSVSSSRSSHYSSGRLSRQSNGSTFNGSAASAASAPCDEPSSPGIIARRATEAPPESLLCCLSKTLMKDPVVAGDGYTYERETIQGWLAAGRGALGPASSVPALRLTAVRCAGVSPVSQEPLDTNILIANKQVKDQLREYRQRNGFSPASPAAVEPPVSPDAVKPVPSVLDRGIYVPSKTQGHGGVGRGPVLVGAHETAMPPPAALPGSAQGRGRRRRGSAAKQQRSPKYSPKQGPNLDGAILVPPPAAPLGFSGMRGGVPVKLPLGPLPQLRANANKRPAPVAPSSSPVGIAGKVRIFC